MRHIWFVGLVLLISFFALGSGLHIDGQVKSLQGTLYLTEGPVTVGWNSVSGAEFYKIELVLIDPVPETTFDFGQTTATQMVLNRPRSGHFKVRVAACNADGCAWSESIDPAYATVDGQPEAWWIFFKTPSPSM